MVEMTDRSTCWSLTEQVESAEAAAVFMNQPVPPGWKLTGQLEEAPTTGQLHLQLKLDTPRIRFGTVKKQFPKAHIEVCRDRVALAKYVSKDDTRIAAVAQPQTPTIWEFNKMVAHKINTTDFSLWILTMRGININNHPDTMYVDGEWMVLTNNIWKSATSSEMMTYVDRVISDFIREGVRGAEYMGVNPMFRSAWKTYGKALIERAMREYEEEIILYDNINNAEARDAETRLLISSDGDDKEQEADDH